MYATIVKYEINYEKRWRVEVKMEGGASFSWKNFMSQADAEAKKEDFFQAIERTQYLIRELAP